MNDSIWKKKNYPLQLENTSKMTHEIFYDNFNKKILLNIFADKNNRVSNLMHYHDKNVHLVLLQMEVLKSKSF